MSQETAELYFPAEGEEEALIKTTHLGIGAHQDDLEILAIHGIIECFQNKDRAFTGVIVTDGAGSVRTGSFASFSDEEMCTARRAEQRRAADIGEYLACVQMSHTSRVVKDPRSRLVVDDLAELLDRTRPEFVYTHNLCDRHETHVAVCLRVIEAVRALPEAHRPKRLIGCEVWRDLDWLPEGRRVSMDLSAHQELQRRLLSVFDSQIRGGKRYDLATIARRRAHATFDKSHQVDSHEALILGMDLSPLARDPSRDPIEFVESLASSFAEELQDLARPLLRA